MASNREDEEWDSIVQVTYDEAQKRFSSDQAFDLEIARVLKVAGDYQVRQSLTLYTILQYTLGNCKYIHF